MTGALALLRHALRRDRILLPVWVLALTGMVAASAFAIEGLYRTSSAIVSAAQVINTSPALVALYGPILNESSLGEIGMSKMTVMYAMFVMGMALVLVRRHTRTEEESGRAELVGVTLVGRNAPLTAAVIEGTIASLLVGVLGAGMDLAAGLPAAGSLAFGLSWTGIGLVGTGLAALCCQLASSTRTCGALTVAVIGVFDVLRAAGDLGPGWIGWLSPLGWGTRLDAWGATRWWVLGLYVAAAAVLVAGAFALRARRDLAAGVFADRPGPARGRLGSLPALVWRLNRTTTVVWVVASVAFGVLFGSITPHLGGLFDSPTGQKALEALGGKGKIEETMLAALLAIMAAMLTAYALQIVVSAGHEETDGRTPPVLAAAGSRARMFLSVVGLALGGSIVLAIGYAVGTSIGFGSQVGGIGHSLGRLVPAALAHVPAMWVVAALATLVWALRPSAVWAGWVLLLGFVTLGEIGPLLKLPDAVVGLSPYQHVVNVPVQPVDWGAEVALLAVAGVVLVAAWWRYARRDIG